MSNKFRPFSKRLTKRIIIVLTLTLALIFAGLFYLATSLTRDINKDMFYCIMDTESEIVAWSCLPRAASATWSGQWSRPTGYTKPWSTS